MLNRKIEKKGSMYGWGTWEEIITLAITRSSSGKFIRKLQRKEMATLVYLERCSTLHWRLGNNWSGKVSGVQLRRNGKVRLARVGHFQCSVVLFLAVAQLGNQFRRKLTSSFPLPLRLLFLEWTQITAMKQVDCF